jgi:DnaJ like chaperone protein
MAIAGKLIGALIGSIAGPFGTLFGGIIGHLFDRAIEERESLNPRLMGGRAALSDPVSQAQINFLACLVGLSIAVADTGGRVTQGHVDALKDFFRRNIPFTRDDQDLIQRLIDEMYFNRARIDIPGMCAYYRSVSGREGRILLIQLLFQTARADGGGVAAQEEDLIRRIAVYLGLEEWTYARVRAAYASGGSRAFEILGVQRDASVEEIKQAYRRLTVENHPDRVANLGPELVRLAEEKFKLIQEAYEEVRRVKGF